MITNYFMNLIFSSSKYINTSHNRRHRNTAALEGDANNDLWGAVK
jgi:hypothetical protein